MAARDEKEILTTPFVQTPRYQRPKWTALRLVVLFASIFAVVFFYAGILYDNLLSAILSSHNGVAKLCPQSDALYPESHAHLWKCLGHDYDEDAFLTRAVAWLGGAVRIPYVVVRAFCCATFFLRLPRRTESFDNLGPIGEDKRWEVFGPFHDYLVQSFPLTCAIFLL